MSAEFENMIYITLVIQLEMTILEALKTEVKHPCWHLHT